MSQTSIIITVKNGYFLDFLDNDLPTPSHLQQQTQNYSAAYWNNQDKRSSYKLTYTIEGYFSTAPGQTYLHDMAARIAHALNGSYEITPGVKSTKYVYNLERFTHLERVPSYNTDLQSNAWNGSRNEIFHAVRQKAYSMKRSNILCLDSLELFAKKISNNSEHCKYLVPNIFEWVEKNYTGKQSIMSRSEAAINASKIKSQRVKDKIFSALRSPGLFNHCSISRSSVSLKVSRNTMQKYLNAWQSMKRAIEILKQVSTPYVDLFEQSKINIATFALLSHFTLSLPGQNPQHQQILQQGVDHANY